MKEPFDHYVANCLIEAASILDAQRFFTSRYSPSILFNPSIDLDTGDLVIRFDLIVSDPEDIERLETDPETTVTVMDGVCTQRGFRLECGALVKVKYRRQLSLDEANLLKDIGLIRTEYYSLSSVACSV